MSDQGFTGLPIQRTGMLVISPLPRPERDASGLGKGDITSIPVRRR